MLAGREAGAQLGQDIVPRALLSPCRAGLGHRGSQRTWRGSKVKGGRVGGAGHIPKNTARKEDRVGEVNFFRGSTKPQSCGTFPGTGVEIPLALVMLGRLEWIRCHQNAQEVSRALSKVCQPQAGAV